MPGILHPLWVYLFNKIRTDWLRWFIAPLALRHVWGGRGVTLVLSSHVMVKLREGLPQKTKQQGELAETFTCSLTTLCRISHHPPC